jgi:hypothetical protein
LSGAGYIQLDFESGRYGAISGGVDRWSCLRAMACAKIGVIDPKADHPVEGAATPY